MKINFLLPHYGVMPTGGFVIVYEYAQRLALKGHDVNVIHSASIDNGIKKWCKYFTNHTKKIFKQFDWKKAYTKVNMIYTVSLNETFIPDADITVATAWQTARTLSKYSDNIGRKFYLIQHYETWNGKKEDVDESWLYDIKKIVISKWLLNIGYELGAKDIVYIPNALELNKFKIVNGIETRYNKTIAMMYSEVEWKGSNDGINALIEAKKNDIEIKAILFGKYSRPKELPEWIEYYYDPEQDFLVNEIYNKASVFLCTSWYEGWGLPPMEAMACGCAVITTDNGGVNDFAEHNNTAMICGVGNISEMCKYIIELSDDRSRRIELAKRGYNKIQEFSWNNSVEKMEKSFYRELSL